MFFFLLFFSLLCFLNLCKWCWGNNQDRKHGVKLVSHTWKRKCLCSQTTHEITHVLSRYVEMSLLEEAATVQTKEQSVLLEDIFSVCVFWLGGVQGPRQCEVEVRAQAAGLWRRDLWPDSRIMQLPDATEPPDRDEFWLLSPLGVAKKRWHEQRFYLFIEFCGLRGWPASPTKRQK